MDNHKCCSCHKWYKLALMWYKDWEKYFEEEIEND